MATHHSTIRLPRSWKRLATVRFEEREGDLFIEGTEVAVQDSRLSWDASPGAFLDDWRRISTIFPNLLGVTLDLASDRSGYRVTAHIHGSRNRNILTKVLDGLDDVMSFEAEDGNEYTVEVRWYEFDNYEHGYD